MNDMTTTDPLREYLRIGFNGDYGAAIAAADALSPGDSILVSDFIKRLDTHATKNSGLLADLTDAIYGKGTAETKGYPRGMVAKARRVFNLLRQCKRQGYLSLTHEHRLISEVK